MSVQSAARAHPKDAFVLAGGGSYGAVQVGMLRALDARGIRPDLVAGSSVGAINGAFYAGDPSAEGIARLEALWRALRRRDVFPVTLSGLLGALMNRDHLFEPSGLRRVLGAHLPYEVLEDSAIPMHVVATDRRTGAPVYVSTGPAIEAVLASCAIPAIYPPVSIAGRELIDGAVACNTPIRTAVELGATRVILLPTRFACPLAASPRGIFGSAFHAMDLVVVQQLAQDTERYSDRVEIVTVPPVCPRSVSPYDFARVSELIDIAARSTEDWLEQGGLTGREASAMVREGRKGCGAQLPSCID